VYVCVRVPLTALICLGGSEHAWKLNYELIDRYLYIHRWTTPLYVALQYSDCNFSEQTNTYIRNLGPGCLHTHTHTHMQIQNKSYHPSAVMKAFLRYAQNC
jgi:hypothetical protein